ncbi:MAG: lysophospholipid acyltransferase family protein [Bacteroidaceae bacterium]|nr:lysophospholipid acyltransferase family protein [Bacteroidaceae bacterium]
MELNKKQRILYRFIRTSFYLISLLPMRLLYVLSDVAYPFVFAFYRRKLVRQQLTECFPEKTIKEIKAIEHAFYHHFCDLVVEMIKQFSMSKEEMMRRMVFVDGDKAFSNFSSEQPILFLMLGHFGDWEWIASLAYWTDAYCSQVYHPLTDDVFDKLFLDLREHYGGECIPMRKTVRRLLQLNAKKQPVTCGMIADQQPRWDAIHHFCQFLGHDSAVFIGTEELAKKFNSLVYYGSVRCIRRGYYECQLIPITINPQEMPDYEITDKYMELLEADIRQHPELWLWTHKRWTRTKEEWKERQQ